MPRSPPWSITPCWPPTPPDMPSLDILRRRFANQHLTRPQATEPVEIVAHLGAVQAQDYAAAKWALALRLRGATDASLDAAFNAGAILRTHVLRPTWHFVAPADVRWLLELTAPRVRAVSVPYLRKHGLDTAALRKSRRVLERNLAGAALTREELAQPLAAAGLPVKGEALAYQLIAAELDGLICSGPRRGKQHSYVLLEERVAPARTLSREEALAELALRYLRSHGPALPQDLAWW